jgi:hypothetical protein
MSDKRQTFLHRESHHFAIQRFFEPFPGRFRGLFAALQEGFRGLVGPSHGLLIAFLRLFHDIRGISVVIRNLFARFSVLFCGLLAAYWQCFHGISPSSSQFFHCASATRQLGFLGASSD